MCPAGAKGANAASNSPARLTPGPLTGWPCTLTNPSATRPIPQAPRAIPRKVVYMPACVTRMMGPSASDYETASVHEKLMSLFAKGG